MLVYYKDLLRSEIVSDAPAGIWSLLVKVPSRAIDGSGFLHERVLRECKLYRVNIFVCTPAGDTFSSVFK